MFTSTMSRSKMFSYKIVLTSLVAATLFALSACSSNAPSSPTTSAPATSVSAGTQLDAHNSTDVSFVTGMIPHHTQAIAMAKTALTHSSNVRVRALATAIERAQGPEIAAMNRWLVRWGNPVSSSSPASMPGMSSATSMPGMMSNAEMAALASSRGMAFDRLWLTTMTSHHRGAISMARAELGRGENPAARALARSIIAGQGKQIAQMTTVLGTL